MEEDKKLTKQEKEVLKLMFKMMYQVIDTTEYIMVDDDTFNRNDLYDLGNKVGVEYYF